MATETMDDHVTHWPGCWLHHHECAIATVKRMKDDVDSARRNADMGNQDAWGRYERARDEAKALRALCREVAHELGITVSDPGSLWYRLKVAASGASLVEHDKVFRRPTEPTDAPETGEDDA